MEIRGRRWSCDEEMIVEVGCGCGGVVIHGILMQRRGLKEYLGLGVV